MRQCKHAPPAVADLGKVESNKVVIAAELGHHLSRVSLLAVSVGHRYGVVPPRRGKLDDARLAQVDLTQAEFGRETVSVMPVHNLPKFGTSLKVARPPLVALDQRYLFSVGLPLPELTSSAETETSILML
jgi:hypothetical protein